MAMFVVERACSTEERVTHWGPGRWLGAPFTVSVSIVLLGLALRTYHYLREPEVWHDEAALIVNVLAKGFSQLLGPLFFSEAAPPLFLWAEKAVTLVLGDSTLALRLVPWLASCAAMILMAPIARRLLPAAAVPWALLLFACSESLAWHACEAKPYAVDVLAATFLLAVFCSGWPVGRRLGVFLLAAPLIVWLCFPGCFLYGGVLVALIPALFRTPTRGRLMAYAWLAAVVVACFGLLLAGSISEQRTATIVYCWHDTFPRWDKPWTVPFWAMVNTAEVCRYCCKPWGQLLAVAAAVGAVRLWRNGQRQTVALLLTPVGLALAAALFAAYPYGGSRVLVYAAPAVALLTAAGIPPVWAWLRARHALATLPLIVLLMAPVAVAGLRVVSPWARPDQEAARAYVLKHLRPDDAIIGDIDTWQYLYYYRHVGKRFRSGDESFGVSLVPLSGRPCCFELEEDARPTKAGRLWVLFTSQDEEERRAFGDAAVAGWRTVEWRDFQFLTVKLVEKVTRECEDEPDTLSKAPLPVPAPASAP
jgi:hypothetical protein